MKEVIKIIVLGAIVVVTYDTVTALVSQSSNISYGLFSIGSFLIYLIFGFLVARKSRWFAGIVAGTVLGLVDSTLGWAISWNLGPGKPEFEMNAIFVAATIVSVVVLASIFGLMGGALSLLGKRSA